MSPWNKNTTPSKFGRFFRILSQAIIVVAASLSATIAVAEKANHHPMRFDHVTLDDGLSQSDVFSILQDSKGLMWIGTENGLNSYNGYEFEHFKRERGNPDALASDYIYDIAEDTDGNLWVATNGGGVAKMSRSTKRFESFRHDPENSNTIASNVVRSILIDNDHIWLALRGDGLDRLDTKTGQFTHYNFGDGEHPTKNPNEIFALQKGAAGTLWVGSNAGLIKLDTESGAVTKFNHDSKDTQSLSDHRVRSIFTDSDGRMWIGTYGGGLNLFDVADGSFERYQHDANDPTSIASDRVTSIYEDNDGRLWIGTFGGLNLFDTENKTFVRYESNDTDPSSLNANAVTEIYQDRGGILWVGTRSHGISKWNPHTWSYGFDNAKQLAAKAENQPNVTSFIEDAAGTLWVGTFGDGLNAVNRKSGSVTRFRHDPAQPDSISDDRIMSLMLDRSGIIWIGTMTGGLNKFDPRTGTSTVYRYDESNPHSLSANGVMSILEDRVGQIWVGTFGGGISRLDRATDRFTHFFPDSADASSLSGNRVTTFAEDSSGKIWVGTDGGGLNLFDPGSANFHHFRHDPNDPNTLATDTVYALNVDAEGTVWVGTQGGGLDRVVGSANDPKSIRFANLSQTDGLANDVIYGLQSDNFGHLWMSTNYGVSRYDPTSGDIKNMHRTDGLQSEEFNFGAHYKSESGELFFGGHNGFNAFRPENLQASNIIPLVMLTGFFKSNDPIKSDIPIDENNGIEISYKDDVVSFEFAALDFAAPEQNRYQYKLEGFDREWIDLGSRRRVTYTDLNDGNYLLRVKAANKDGVWNDAGLSIPVTVSPAPWDTWWAYLGYLAMFTQIVVACWLGHRRKIRREEEYSERLELEVQYRTEKLIESNEQLQILNESLQESSLSDPLTGLRNRRFVFEEVSKDIEVVRRKINDQENGVDAKSVADLVFMMIDLDNFKPINDTYGHAAGDQILLDVRDVLLGTCRKSDFVIRWGGDEFVVIAKQAKPGEAEALAERIRSRIAEHSFMLGDGQVVRTTCSIGFAAYPLFRGQVDNADLDQIMSLADSLMYEAKKRRNAWAGMLTPNDAATSFELDQSSIEPTSLLFRAKRAGRLLVHDSDDGETKSTSPVAAIGY